MSNAPAPASPAGDLDAQETREWLDALSAAIEAHGKERGHFLIEQLLEHARQQSIDMPFSATTGYVNTIEPGEEARCPGNIEIEERLRAYMRWNAMAMVVKANRHDPEDGGDLGGHIGSFASVAHMFGAGFNHFWHADDTAKGGKHGGDLLYIQGHSAPGIYARAYLEGRISEEQMLNFRQEVDGKGLSSYPHPKLMPNFWQFPTVSMGLGPLMAIYQARFLKYIHARSIAETSQRKVWAFMGDGEMDEPESLGAIGLAAREKLDNLVFVINCNLQRLDGPVRGNGKIIQELEGEFRGAGWNVIKVVWGSNWDPLLAKDKDGILRKVMMDTLDGDYQAFKANDGAYVRKHFFGRDPKTLEMVAHMTDDEIWELRRGGHDPHKVYAAYHRAVNTVGQPTVILVKTVKGFGMGKAGEGKMAVHQTKKLSDDDIRYMRDRFNVPIPDSELQKIPFYKPANDTPEMKYLHERRKALGGYLPDRRSKADEQLKVPPLETFKSVIEPTPEGREISTTQAYVRFLTQLLRDKELGPRAVPILVDEARTFGMEGLFRQIGIYNPEGQKYTPVDKDQVMYYKEDKAGQILQEGINEAGGMASFDHQFADPWVCRIDVVAAPAVVGGVTVGDTAEHRGIQVPQARGPGGRVVLARVVVDDVDPHVQSAFVRGGDQLGQFLGGAVGLVGIAAVHGTPHQRHVAPVVVAVVEGVHRHQLDDVRAHRHHMVEPLDAAAIAAAEALHVQLVHRRRRRERRRLRTSEPMARAARCAAHRG